MRQGPLGQCLGCPCWGPGTGGTGGLAAAPWTVLNERVASTGKAASPPPQQESRAPEAENRGAEVGGMGEQGHEPEHARGPSGNQGQGQLPLEAQEPKEPFKFE